MNYLLDIQHRARSRHRELLREADSQRLADAITRRDGGARRRIAALLYALATRLDESLAVSTTPLTPLPRVTWNGTHS